MSVNGALMICDLAYWIISWQWNADNPQWTYQQPLCAKMLLMILRPASTIKHPHSINSFGRCSELYTPMNCIVLFLNRVLCCQSWQSVLVYNFPNMHAMSYRSDFFPCSCRLNVYEPAFCFTVSLLSAVSQVGSTSVRILTALSESKLFNTSLLEVMISSKNDLIFFQDLSNLTLQIVFNAWWASMNEDSKRPISWNNSRPVPS
jgi:hypothetical protein